MQVHGARQVKVQVVERGRRRMVRGGKEGSCSSNSSSSGSGEHLEVQEREEKWGEGHGVVGRECKCRFREEEKQALRELNSQHLEMMRGKQATIARLTSELDTLREFRESFRETLVTEERRQVEDQMRRMEERLQQEERWRTEEAGKGAAREVSWCQPLPSSHHSSPDKAGGAGEEAGGDEGPAGQVEHHHLTTSSHCDHRREEEARRGEEEAARLRAERDAALEVVR